MHVETRTLLFVFFSFLLIEVEKINAEGSRQGSKGRICARIGRCDQANHE